MAYKFPANTAEALSTGDQIVDVAMARGLLEHCARLQKILYDMSIERVWPEEAKATARGTLDTVNSRTTLHYSELSTLGEWDPVPSDLAGKVNVDVFQTEQLSRQLDELIGTGYTSAWMSSIIEGFGTVGQKVLDKVGTAAAAAADIPKSAFDALKKIVDSLGWLGWVALGVVLLLAVGVFVSLKEGVVPK